MKTRNLGTSGLRVSLVGLGCNNFGERVELERARAIVHRALDLGVTLFDTADRYGGDGASESALGEIFGSRRKDIVLATKFGLSLTERRVVAGASRGYIMTAVEGSLRRLRTDWIDLYQVHTPDPRTPIEETLRALEDLVWQGKVRYTGVSNFPAWRVVETVWTGRTHNLAGISSVQDEYSLIFRGHEAELIPAIEACGLGFLPYRPLASGILTGKYQRGESPPEGTRMARQRHQIGKYMRDANFDKAEKLHAFAIERGHTLTELACSWLAAKPFVSSIIPGATTVEQVETNVSAVNWKLTADDLEEIDRLSA
jgi:aryl-alcohol dehydrogenase-like predicted oxidoreductase